MSNAINVFGGVDLEKAGLKKSRELVRRQLDYAVGNFKKSFLTIGYLAAMASGLVPKIDGFSSYVIWENCRLSIVDYLMQRYNFKKTSVYAAIDCYKQFCISTSPGVFALKEAYADYSQSQLVELLPMSAEERKKVSPDMSVRDIRKLKQSLKPTKPDKVLPPVQDPPAVSDASETFSGRPENPAPVSPAPTVCAATEPPAASTVQKTVLTTDKTRKEWIRAYEKWGVWIDVPDLNMKYYRYNVDRKTAFIVTEVTSKPQPWNPSGKSVYWHLCGLDKDGKPNNFTPGGCALSVLTDYLQRNKVAVTVYESCRRA